MILAAGGIVFRGGERQQIAVVQLRKYRHWVLPKGKLKRNEHARNAAKREVLEETGHRVTVQEFIGAISYESRGRPKIVQFWRMEVLGDSVCDPASDIKEVRWLSIKKAIEMLTYPREQIFLRHIANPTRRRRRLNGAVKAGSHRRRKH